MATVSLLVTRVASRFGTAIIARMATMATTIMSSMRVNPRLRWLVMLVVTALGDAGGSDGVGAFP